ncbi:hypothetical protein [Undibacterium flavidum]|uniref:Uncharacterized protein n=1 Tax=Undibacterium flavidum TaxID=2762297 RepID=A0ABR6YG57_9BURK|nr:hypothetical protein [Undibacterium flavidum]MBC3875512.1 hypothetical protein [Undibacterium flavidum]
MQLKNALICVAVLLSGCQTVQNQSIPLHKNFLDNADQLEIKRPTWRLRDSVYQQHLPGYEIHSTETAWAKTDRTQLWFSESGGLLEGFEIKDKFLRLLFLDLLDLRRQTRHRYLFHSEQDFAFALTPNNADKVQVRCRRVAIEDHLDIVRFSGNQRSSTTELRQRLNSYLACELQQNDKQWRLTVNATDLESASTPKIELQEQIQGQIQRQVSDQIQEQMPTTANETRFELIKQSSYLVNGEWRTMTFGPQQFSGLQIQYKNQTVAATSLDGATPKIWLNKDLPTTQKSLLLAINYSLMMYDWLDSGWRKGQ